MLVREGSFIAQNYSEVFADDAGRLSIIQVHTPHDFVHLANVYAPSNGKPEREAFFDSIKQSIELPFLIIAGDWNFCPDCQDKFSSGQMVEPERHPVTEQILQDLELEDVYRHWLWQDHRRSVCEYNQTVV